MAYDYRNAAQYLSDVLGGIGQGFLTAPRNGPPLAGLGIGLQTANQLTQQRQQAERERVRDAMVKAQFDQQQKAQAEAEATKAAAQKQFSQLLPTGGANATGFRKTGAGPMSSASVPPSVGGDPAFLAMPSAAQSYIKARGAYDPAGALDVFGELALKSPETPKSQTFYDGNSQYEGILQPDGTIKRVTENSPRWQAPQPPQMPADVQEYLYAKNQGFKGTYMEWKASLKGQGLSVTLPDGTVVQQGGSVKPPNESQMQAGNRAQLVQDGLGKLEALYNDPNISPWNVGIADTVGSLGPIGAVAGSTMKSDAEQQFSAAKASALEGMAASITGAGVSKDQFERYSQMLPDITDKPGTRKAKLQAANDYLKVVLRNAGAAAAPVLEIMKNKGAAESNASADQDMARVPEFTDPNDPALKALPSGAEFYSIDANGQKTKRFVP